MQYGYRGEFRVQLEFESYLLRDRAAQQTADFVHVVRQVDRAFLGDALARVGEQLAGEGGRVLCCLQALSDRLPRRVPERQVEHGKFGITDDTLKEVVEIVGDAACQDAETVHLLRTHQLALELAPLFVLAHPIGDVDNGSDERNRAEGRVKEANRAVADHPDY